MAGPWRGLPRVGTAVYVIEMCLTTGASPKRVDAPSPFISLRSRGGCAWKNLRTSSFEMPSGRPVTSIV